jgi:hypothetical protein
LEDETGISKDERICFNVNRSFAKLKDHFPLIRVQNRPDSSIPSPQSSRIRCLESLWISHFQILFHVPFKDDSCSVLIAIYLLALMFHSSTLPYKISLRKNLSVRSLSVEINPPLMLMKTVTLVFTSLAFAMASSFAADWKAGMKEGPVALKSAGPISFGPEGILFVADTQAAAILAIATGDTTPAKADAPPLKIEGLADKLAGLLGTAPDQLLINDLAVNPISQQIYLAVSRGRGPDATPVLMKVSASGEIGLVPLDKATSSRGELPDAPIAGVVGEGARKSNPRLESITDLAFLEDRVLVAGLSNEEFASTLRAVPFPFQKVVGGTSVEIYHGAHGKFETRAPVRTFVPFMVGNEPSLLAAYTCTPLVQFPLKELQPGAKIKGKTIAELGNRNRPLDMIVYKQKGQDFLLLSNSSRGVMKFKTEQLEQSPVISAPVANGQSQGLTYETIADWKGIEQLDKLNDKTAVVITNDGGKLTLETKALP